jgi:hypothetical protein
MNAERGQAVKERTDALRDTALFDHEAGSRYQERWHEIQAQFVDDPRSAVEAADELVAELTKELVRMFTKEREGLEKDWASGGDPSTEDLRVALQRYRSFFGRLLGL